MRNIGPLFIIFFLILCAGCEAKDVNDTSIPIGIGFDWEEDKFKISTQLAKPLTAEQGGHSGEEESFIVVSETGETIIMASRNLLLTLPRVPLWTYASVIVLGENLVTKDAALYSDVLARNPNIRNNAMVVVCKDITPEDLFQVKTPLEPLPALGITKILNNQEKQLGIYVPISLGDFLQKAATPGIELIIPMVTVIKNGDTETLKVDGSAIFADRKMVGSFNEKESRGYRWLNNKPIQGGVISIPDPQDPQKLIGIEVIRSTAKVKPIIDKKGVISVNIKIEAESNFYEQHSTNDLLNLKGFTAIEKLAAQEIEKEIALAIIRAQELNSDIFGWGKLLNHSYPEVWREIEADWNDYFPHIKTNIDVKFRLRRSYLTDESFKFR